MYYLWKARVRQFLYDDSGIGVVEMILILLVLIGLVVIFKTQITSIANSVFSTIRTQLKKL